MTLAKIVFTTGELADLLHIHQTTVIDWIEKGLIKGYRTPGGHRRVEHTAILDFLHRHKMPVPEELEGHPKGALNPLGEHRRPRKT